MYQNSRYNLQTFLLFTYGNVNALQVDIINFNALFIYYLDHHRVTLTYKLNPSSEQSVIPSGANFSRIIYNMIVITKSTEEIR